MQTELSHTPFESVHVEVKESDESLARVKLSAAKKKCFKAACAPPVWSRSASGCRLYHFKERFCEQTS